eukprot:4227957-Pleurochrysis_carterae.AAC.1
MAVRVDARTGERFPARLNVPLMHVNTPFRMFLNAALPMDLVSAMVKYMNQRLHEEDHSHRKTTVGEIIQFIGYIGA